MNKKIFSAIMIGFTLMLIVLGAVEVRGAELQDVFVLLLEYNKGEITAQSVFKTRAVFYPSINQPEDGYTIGVYSFDDKILYSEKFDFPLGKNYAPDPSWFDENGKQIFFPKAEEVNVILDKAEVDLMIPYYIEASKIKIIDKEGQEALVFKVNTNQALVEVEYNEELEEEEDSQVTTWLLIGIILVGLIAVIVSLIKLLKRV